MAWSGSLDTSFSVDEAFFDRSCRGVLRTFPSCVIHPCSWLREGTFSLVHIEFSVKTLHLGTVSVCLAWSSLVSRYCCCVDCLYCDLDIWYFIASYLMKLETEDQRDLKYGVFRIIGSGATVQSVSRSLLVVKETALIVLE